MTESEAKFEIIEHIPMICFTKYVKALNIAIEALEKQIPKKVVRVKLRPSEYGSEYRCPVCESDLIPIIFFNDDGTEPDEKISWCSGCGQKLDWSE